MARASAAPLRPAPAFAPPQEAGASWVLYTLLALAGAAMLFRPAAAWIAAGALWIAFAASYVWRPERTLLLYIVLAPTLAIMPGEFRLLPGINFDTLVIPALAVAVALREPDPDEPEHNPLWAPVLVYVLLLALSALFSYVLGRAYTQYGSQWVPLDAFDILKTLKAITMFTFLGPIAFRLLRTPALVRSAVYLMAGATAFIAIEAALGLREREGEVGTAVRAMNFWLNQPNLLGGFFGLMVVPLAAVVLGGGRRGLARIFLILALAATSVGLVLTFSRGAWIAAFAGLAYLGLTRGIKIAAGLALLAGIAAFFIPQSAIDRMGSTFEEPAHPFAQDQAQLDYPVQVRVNQWKELPGLFLDSPVWGHGYESYRKVATGPTEDSYAAHSSIISLAVELGALGLAAYGWIVWVFCSTAWTVQRRPADRFTGAVAAGLIGMTVCLVLLDASGQKFFDNRVMPCMWILAGAVARQAQLQREARP